MAGRSSNTLARPEAILELKLFQVNLDDRLITLNPPGREQTKKRRPTLPITDTLFPWLENAILAKFYDLFRDTREEWPVSTEIGAWGGAKFVRMVQRHLGRKAKYPDNPPATGMPYAGIDNLRPETIAAVEEFLFMMQTPGM